MGYWRWVLALSILSFYLLPGVIAADAVTYRLTIQIHEAPGPNSFFVFYFNRFDFSEENLSVHRLSVLLPSIPVEGISLYPLQNGTTSRMRLLDKAEGKEIQIETNSTSVELRFYAPMQAVEVGRHLDLLLTYGIPKVVGPVRGLTIAVNWPNWKYQIRDLSPPGAEESFSPLFETDPYKVVSYYWYFSADEISTRAPDTVSVTLRLLSTVARINRNQSILVFLLVVCVPTAIFVAKHPPRTEPRKEREFKIADQAKPKKIKRRRFRAK